MDILISEDVKNHSLADANYFRDRLDQLPVGTYHVYVTKEKVRSLDQNAYYWGVILEMISGYTGHTVEELHRFFKVKFNSKGKRSTTGNVLAFGGTTTKMNTVRFRLYCESIRLWAMYFLGVEIPEPKQVTEEMKLEALSIMK